MGSSPPFHFVNGFDLFPMLLGSLRSKVSFLCLFQWFQDCVSKVSFFLFRSGNRIICSLARAFKLSLFFKFFKFFIFNKLCTRWSTRVSRVHCTFLSGLLYFFVGSIELFCRVYLYFCDFIKYIMVRDKAFTFYKKYIYRDKKIIVGAILWQADGTKRKL